MVHGDDVTSRGQSLNVHEAASKADETSSPARTALDRWISCKRGGTAAQEETHDDAVGVESPIRFNLLSSP